MGISLNEEEAGSDREIWYPNLQTCLSVTACLDDGRLLGTHLTTSSRERAITFIFDHLRHKIGRANVLGIYLIGNLEAWKTKEEADYRYGEYLSYNVKRGFGAVCPVYAYDSVADSSGGIGAALHVIHSGGRHPDFELVAEDDWSVFTFDKDHPATKKLDVLRAETPSQAAMQFGKKEGMQTPKSFTITRSLGAKKTIKVEDMKLKLN